MSVCNALDCLLVDAARIPHLASLVEPRVEARDLRLELLLQGVNGIVQGVEVAAVARLVRLVRTRGDEGEDESREHGGEYGGA